MGNKLVYGLHENPIVAAIHASEDVEKAIATDISVAFILDTDIFDLPIIIEKLQRHKIMAFVHFDLLEGLSNNEIGLKFLKENFNPDGIITTRNNIVQKARKLNLYVIQRLFLLDSINMKSGIESVKRNKPDAVEILPGRMHDITKELNEKINQPLIVGGLIRNKTDVINALKADAMGVSTSNYNIWQM